MKGRALQGKTVKKVHQVLDHPGDNRPAVWVIDSIEFTDGTHLRFSVVERDDDYSIEGIYPARAHME